MIEVELVNKTTTSTFNKKLIKAVKAAGKFHCDRQGSNGIAREYVKNQTKRAMGGDEFFLVAYKKDPTRGSNPIIYGFARAEITRDATLYISIICSKSRSGSILMNRFKEISRNWQMPIILDTVNNARTRAFYKKMGMTQISKNGRMRRTPNNLNSNSNSNK